MRDFLKLNSACVDATELTADSIGELAIHWPEDIDCDVKNITRVAQIMPKSHSKSVETTAHIQLQACLHPWSSKSSSRACACVKTNT